LRTAEKTDADAMYICGTGVRARPVIAALERALGKPVVSANLAALWAVLDELGHADRFSFGASGLLEWQRRANAR
jgi:maleate isomerase